MRLTVLAAAALSVLAALVSTPTSQAAPWGGHVHATPRPAALTKAAPATRAQLNRPKLRHRRTLGQRAVRIARNLLGVRYRRGGASPSNGFDCSGLVQYVYGKLGFQLPHYSVGQFRYGRRVHRSRLRPGDLLFFSGLGHVGLYVGRGSFIDAPHSGAVVRVNSLAGRMSSFVGARRLGR